MNRLPNMARRISPAASTMPAAIDQNKKMISLGSLMAVWKRMIDRAPTMPRLNTILEVTARITSVVTIVRPIRVTPKDAQHSSAYRRKDVKSHSKGARHRQHHVKDRNDCHVF